MAMSVVKTLDLSQVTDVKSLFGNNFNSSTVIPEAYIQPLKHQAVNLHRHASSNPGETIPVVDLANSRDHDKREDVVRAIGDACEKWGFFQIINHGFNPNVVRRMLEATDKFFDLPLEEKMAYYSLDLTKPLRYGTSYNPHKDSALQWRDYMNIPCKLIEDVVQSWPSVFRKEALDYIHEMNNLTKLLLELVSESLQLTPNTLEKLLGPDLHHHNLAINYYPPCPQPDRTIGFRGHSDKSTITILLQDGVAGLQVAHEGDWFPVEPRSDAFVVNLGDVMEILSNGRYKSIEHRVIVNSKSKRLSLASLYNVAPNAMIGPLLDLVDESHPLVFKEIVFMDFFKKFASQDLDGKNALDCVRIRNANEA